MILAALAALLAQSSSPPAAPAPAPGPQCFDMSRFDRIRATRPDALFVRSAGRTYRIATLPCPLMAEPSSQITLKARAPGPVCGPVDLELKVRASGGGVTQTCAVQAITPLSDAETEALPSKDRP